MIFTKPTNPEVDSSVRYSCNFSNRDIRTNQFSLLLQEHKDQIHRAIILDVSQNLIEDLSLEHFPLIETIKASNNILKKINLSLAKLVKLDLSFNRLKSIPDFSGVPKLRILLLNNNSISELSKDDFTELKSLSILELSHNKIKFKEVQEFTGVVNSWGSLSKLSLINNPFTYSEIYNRKYFEYIENSIQSLESLNGKSLLKSQKKKGIIQVIVDQMLQEELKSSNSNSVLEKIKEKLESISISQIDVNAVVVEEIRELIKLYEEKLSQNHFEPEEEYVKDDKDTEIFEDLLNYAVFCVETISKLGKILVELFIFLSCVRKGKWAKQCFGFLKHLADSDDELLPLIEMEINEKYKMRLSKLDKKDIAAKNVNNIDFLIQLEDTPLVLGAIKMFVNPDFPIIIDLLYAFIVSLLDFYEKEELDKILNHLANHNNPDKISTQIKKPIYLLFKYSIEILSLCYRKTCYTTIDDDISYEQLYVFFSLTDLFAKEFVQNKNLNNKKFHKMFQNLLKLIKKIMANQTLQTTHRVVLAQVVEEFKKKKIIDIFRNYIYSYYVSKKQALFPTNNKLLKETLILNILNNLTVRYLFKIFLFFLSYLEDKSWDINYVISLVMNNNKIQADSNIDFNCDPVMLELSVYAIGYLLKNINLFWNFENMSTFYSFMENINSQIAYFIFFIDEEKDNYKKANVIADIYVAKEEIYRETLKINENNNVYILRLINSIVCLLKFFNEQGKYQKDSQIRKMFQNLNNILNKIDRDNLLIICLTSQSSKIKSNVISCFLFASYDQIEGEELYKLLCTLSESNWLDGKMEIIISNTFFFVLKYSEIRFNEACKLFRNSPSIIHIVLNILEINTGRTLIKYEDIDNIRALNAACVALLINFSGYKELRSYFDNIDYSEKIRKILVNEYNSVFYYSKIKANPKKRKKINLANNDPILFPLEIEKCFTGWKTERIKSFINSDGITPYNYISARVFNHLANSLMNIPYKIIDISNQEFLDITSIISIYSINEVKRISLEKLTWKLFKQQVNKQHQEDLTNLQNTLGDNSSILFSKEFSIYEQQLHLVQNFRFFLDWLIGNSSGKFMNELSEKLNKEKFDPNLNPEKTVTNSDSNSLDALLNMLNKDFDMNKLNERNIKDVSKLFLRAYNSNKSMQSRSNQEDYYNSHMHVKNDLNIEDKYAISAKMVKRNIEYECVDNPQLRSLFISIFLRCIYSVLIKNQLIKDSHPISANIRSMMHNNSNNLIQQLRSYESLQKLTSLVDSSRLESFNIPTKFLVILTKILKNLSIQNENGKATDHMDKLILLSAMMIAKILHKMNNKTNFDDDDTELVSSLVKCCLTITFEINFVNIDKKMKNKIVQKIMTERLVRILIATLNNAMITENDKIMNGDNANYVYYNIIMIRIARLLAEFMSMSQNNSYRVYELLNIKINLDKKEIRKTYIKDLIRFCSFTKLKEEIKNFEIFKGLKIILVTDCLFINHDNRKIAQAIFLFSKEGIYFLECNNQKKVQFQIPIADVKKVYMPIFSNRIFIALNKKGISILFKDTLATKNIYRDLLAISSKIEIANNCFLDTEEFLSFKEINNKKGSSTNKSEENSKVKKDLANSNSNTKLQTDKELNKTNPDLNLSISQTKKEGQLNDKQLTSSQFKKLHSHFQRSRLDKSADRIKLDSKLHLEAAEDKSNEKMNRSFSNISRKNLDNKNEELDIRVEIFKYEPANNIFLVKMESKSMRDWFGVENRYVYNPKILYFEKDKNDLNTFKTLRVISENYDSLAQVDVDDSYLSKDGKYFDYYKNCYKTESVFYLDNLEAVTFLSVDTIEIKITFNSIKFSVLDDFSYFNIRQILVMMCKKKNLNYVKKI